MGMDFMFDIFPIIFMLMFALVFGTIIITLIRSISQWNKNNEAPVLTVSATVVSKRQNFSSSHHHTTSSMHHSSANTFYFVTFEVESGDRMELNMAGHEYGMLIEGDYGKLTFQGTRYLNFERF